MGESGLPSATSVPTLRDATSHEVFLKCRPAERLRQDLVIGGIGPQSPLRGANPMLGPVGGGLSDEGSAEEVGVDR